MKANLTGWSQNVKNKSGHGNKGTKCWITELKCWVNTLLAVSQSLFFFFFHTLILDGLNILWEKGQHCEKTKKECKKNRRNEKKYIEVMFGLKIKIITIIITIYNNNNKTNLNVYIISHIQYTYSNHIKLIESKWVENLIVQVV